MKEAIRLNFSQAEVLMLKSHLEYAAGRLQAELDMGCARSTGRGYTFRQMTRLLRWQRYFATLAHTLLPDPHRVGPLDVNLPSVADLLGEEAGLFLDFLCSERYRARMAASYIQAQSQLEAGFKQEMIRALELEARFYGDLLDHLAGLKHLSLRAEPASPIRGAGFVVSVQPNGDEAWQPDGARVPLLFISLPQG